MYSVDEALEKLRVYMVPGRLPSYDYFEEQKIKSFLQVPGVVDYVDDKGQNLLHLFIGMNADPRIIAILIEAGVAINQKGLRGSTPLMLAINHDDSQGVVDNLIKQGADTRLRDDENHSAADNALDMWLDGFESAMSDIETLNEYVDHMSWFFTVIEVLLSTPQETLMSGYDGQRLGDALLAYIERMQPKINEIFRNDSSIRDMFLSLEYAIKPVSNQDFLHAAVDGNVFMIQRYLFDYVGDQSINTVIDDHGKSALMLAAENDHLEVVKILLSKGLSLSQYDHAGHNALMLAIKNGANNVATYLVSTMSIEALMAHQVQGVTAAAVAVEHANAWMSSMICSRFFLITDESPVMAAALSGDQLFLNQMLSLRQQQQQDVFNSLPEEELRSKVPAAIRDFNRRSVLRPRSASDYAGTVFERDSEGRTVLHCLINSKYLRRYRNQFPARLSGHQLSLFSNIYMSAQTSLISMMNYFLSQGVDINALDYHGNTPLIAAADTPLSIFLSLLINRNAKLDIQNDKGETALMVAVRRGYIDSAERLLEAGADATLRNRNGKSAIDLAVRSKNEELIRLFDRYVSKDVNLKRPSDSSDSSSKRLKR